MSTKKNVFKVLVGLIVGALVLSACGSAATSTAVSAPSTQTPAAQAPAATQPPVGATENPAATQPPVLPTDDPAAPSGPQGSLTVALAGEPNSLYIPDTADTIADTAASQLYDSLVYHDPAGNYYPELATSWEVAPDNVTWTFHLRQGVTFQNGDPFTADDVIATWKYGSDPKTSSWPEEYTIAKSVEKVDDYTVKVITDGPNALLLYAMFDFWDIIPGKYMDKVGVDAFQQHPIGTGPFEFVDWVKGDHITYKANPNYWWKGYPKVENLTFRFVPEDATRAAAIQSGEVDIVNRLTADEANTLSTAPNVVVSHYLVPRVYYVMFNNMSTGKGQPTMDPKVRQAMNYAVDVDGIIKSLFDGYGQRAIGMINTGQLGYGNVKPFPYDPVKAKQLLTEAGYPNGFTMSMNCPSDAYASIKEVCEAIVANLGAVGIKINLTMQESGQFWDEMSKKTLPPLAVDSWSDASGETVQRSEGLLSGGTYSTWLDPKIVDMLNNIQAELDTSKRAALYQAYNVYMQENPPLIYLYEPVTFEAIRSNVHDYTPQTNEMMYLYDTWVSNP
ncbi:MAG TPA: ABC transporter substrate-binding protein [Anaerolineales bacterium]|nr:ABC transporter substrate-binding protein [Anaerolineales bacterium]